MKKANKALCGLSLQVIAFILFLPNSYAENQMATIRIGSSLSESNSEVTSYSEEEVRASASSDVGEFLRQRGLSVLRQGGEGQLSSLNVRGAEAEHLLVVVDGVPLNDASNPSRSFDLTRIPLSEVRRMELIKGPQSVRYGSQALGGVLRIWTYATADESKIQFGGKVGNLKSSEAHISALQNIGAGFQVGASGQFYETESFSAAAGGKENDTHRSQSGGASLGYISEHFRSQYAFRRVNQETDIDRGGGETNDDPNNVTRFRQDSHSLITQAFPTESFQAQLALGYSQLERHYQNLPDANSTTQSWSRYFGEQSRAELSFDNQWGESLMTTFGFEATVEQGRGDSSFSNFPESDAHKEDVFALAQYKLSDWTFNAGVRREDHSEFGDNWSAEAGLGFDLNENQRLQLRWAQGTRWPSLYQLYDPTYGNSNLTPEESQALELAWSYTGESFQSTLTLFQTEYDNLLDYDSTTFRAINVGEAKIRGVETDASLATGNWNHYVRYQYLEPRKTSTDTELIRRPRHELYFSESYLYGQSLTSLWARYKGSREDRDPVSFTSPVELEAYWVFGLHTQYDFDSFRLWASIENLTQKTYQEVAGYQASPRRFWLGFEMEL